MGLVVMALVSVAVSGGNWPQWRGPLLNGASPETNMISSWNPTDGALWTAPLPGKSGATPVIWDDAVFVTSPDTAKDLWLFCLNRRDGSVRWKSKLDGGDSLVAKNNLSTPSPVTDGQRVIALCGTGELACFDFKGNELWRRHLALEYGLFAFMFRYGSSPLLWNDKLYVQVIQRNPPTYGYAQDDKPVRESYVLCLEPASGKTLWRQVRATDALEEAMECYTTPMPCLGPNGMELVIHGADCVTGHDPETGAELWRFSGINLKKIAGGRIVPSAVATPGFLHVCGPKREMLVTLRLGGRGLLHDDAVAWKTTENVPDVCTPLYYRGKLFVLDGDRQILACYDPPTGKKHWQGRLGVREIFDASPTGADGKLYCVSEEGTVIVLSAGDAFEILATISLGEGPCIATIAVSDGQLFVRTAKNLYCIGKRTKMEFDEAVK